MKKKLLPFVIVICLLIIIILIAVPKMMSKKDDEMNENVIGNTAGNMYNKGYFCESDDGYIYFSNAYDNYSLYRMKPDETDIVKLISTETEQIISVGKHFYYFQKGSGSGSGLGYIFNTNGIYRADSKTGLNTTCINMSNGTEMAYSNNKIYFYSEENGKPNTSCMNTDGENKEKVLDYKVSFANAGNGKIYFTDGLKDMYLKVFDIKTKGVSTVVSEDMYMPIVEGSKVYYIDIHDNYSLAVYDILTQTKTTLDKVRTDIINTSDNYIYYQTSGKNPQFKRIAKNAADPEIVLDGVYSDINITSNTVYFHEFNRPTPVYKTSANGPIQISIFDAAKKAALSK